jgi:hypothetical protein
MDCSFDALYLSAVAAASTVSATDSTSNLPTAAYSLTCAMKYSSTSTFDDRTLPCTTGASPCRPLWSMILWRRGHVSAGRPALEATTANMEEVVE